MIHVASLLHDDVLDDADTTHGIGCLNFVMRNKKKINKGKLVNMNIEILTIMMMQLAVLAGYFLLFRACITLASLKNTEVSTIPLH
uniref:Polyprenyl synthetase n=1 Tax=Lactuca sativa TaxID=4236 RepID=A0A9R1W3X9_LACSA|nr:hypothetical protein LSAT_V11C300153520 [Lactuca sativa]